LLEKEIIRRTTDYSSSTANINPSETNNRNEAGDQIQIPAAGNNGTTGNRVSGLGTALKDACGINNVIPNGTSNEIASGGFNILLAGTLFNNVSGFGGAAAAWTSSSYSTNPSSDSSWFRSLSSGSNNLVYRYTALRVAMYSVRCVKD
jgi:hypothetical protein